TYFAIHRLGAIIVPINAKLVQREVMYIIQQSDAKVFITHESIFSQVQDVPKEADLLFIKTGEAQGDWHSFETLLTNGSSEALVCDVTEEDEASILYTSGTTGNPKGVVFTNRSILTIATTICIELEMKPNSRILHMMPLSHSAPLHDFLISVTYVGATHVLASSFSPVHLLQKLDKYNITHLFGAPVAYLQTIRHPDVGEYDLTSMKHWVYGGAATSQHDVRRVRETCSIDHLICLCDPTETGPNGRISNPAAPDAQDGRC